LTSCKFDQSIDKTLELIEIGDSINYRVYFGDPHKQIQVLTGVNKAM